ncbi:methyltransferase domain-containing protein [Pelobacter seleniigenes]|uniref:methyltransferase domain-containing protein n=1 Tax=Pelobacter seleniigenes TaxID=407188 RepID=UPI0004A7334B|nr:methyltransferase domain-containing protein [Pelobacter seleniigenes]
MLAVQRSFDRAAASYRQAATVQAEAAAKLAALLDMKHCRTVLEIGSGDGLFTEKLVDRVKIETLLTLDIARAPLLRLPAHLAPHRIQADAEALPIRPGSIDLLVSSSSLQWLSQPEQSIPRLLSCLRPGGTFLFALFCRGTFAEMAQLNQSSGFGRVYPLPGEQQFLQLLQRTTRQTVTMQAETVIRSYPDVMTLLHTQQATGAGYSGHGRAGGRAALQAFIRSYEQEFANQDGTIPASYRLAYFKGSMSSVITS